MEEIFTSYVERFSDKLLEYAPRMTTAVAVLVVTLLVSMAIRRTIVAVATRHKLSGQKMEVSKLIASAASSAVVVLGIISSLGTLGINISALIAGLGLSGFALGFALRDALSNLLSGVLIILYQPFKVGDRIVVAGFEGDVSEINLRYTILRSDGNKFLIPNANIFSNTVTVKGRN